MNLSELSQSTESVQRVSTAGRTNGRTDGLTEKVVAEGDPVTAVDARRGHGLESIGQVINRGLSIAAERHPVVRIGERALIPRHIRSAVWFRDHGRCELCPYDATLSVWELDHIIPWSAGGSDDSTNLRVLCRDHNQERSNRIDPSERPRRAVTWWCTNCFTYADDSADWWDYAKQYVMCPTHKFNPKRCTVASGYLRTWDLHDEVADWHQRPSILEEDAVHVAYCVHCHRPGLTDRPL